MDELIRITTDAQGALVVSASELHYFLEIEDQFTQWLAGRVSEYNLIESLDYILKGDVPEIDYALTLDAAKELATAEGNDKGKQAYQYFIDCERIAQAQASFPPADLTRLFALLTQQDQLLTQYNEPFMTTDIKADQPEPGAGKQPPYQLYSLSFREGKDRIKQWHYDRHGQPQANGWTILSEPCPEYQLKLFTYFMDFTPERRNVSGEAMKQEWFHFKHWLHWLEACGVDCQAMQLPRWEKMEQVFKQVREQSQPADY